MEVIKKYWLLLVIGLVLRLVLAGVSFHPDVRTVSLSSAVFFQKQSLNFYEESKKLASQEILDDLPLSYLILLPVHGLLRPFVDIPTENVFLNSTQSLLGSTQLNLYLVYTKMPLIFFDMLLGFVLTLSLRQSLQKKILTFWMFNPFTLWATAMIGQMDVVVAFFITLVWLLITNKKLSWAALVLGMGGAIKSSPFLLMPLLVGLGGSFKEKLKLMILLILPYILTVLPYIPNKDFRQDALLAPQLAKTFYAHINLSGGEAIYLVPAILGALYLIYFSRKREARDFLNFSIIALLLILAFTHFHIQWFLWVMPLLLLWLIANWTQGIKLATAGLFLSLLMMIFLFDASLQLKLLAPIFPALDGLRGLAEISTNNQSSFLRSITASVFAACAIFLIWKIRKN